MAPNALAQDIYLKTVERMDGRRSKDVAGELQHQADVLKEQTAQQTKQTVNKLSSTARHDLVDVVEQRNGTITAQEREQTAEKLRDAAKTVGERDVTVRKKEGNVAADARLSVKGSAEFDLRKSTGDDGLPDAKMMRADYVHEVGEDDTEGHEHQVAPDAASVQVGGKTIDSTAFVEIAPILAQTEKVPESLDRLSTKYQGYYRDLTALMPDRERLQELSMKGQFRQFAQEAMAA